MAGCFVGIFESRLPGLSIVVSWGPPPNGNVAVFSVLFPRDFLGLPYKTNLGSRIIVDYMETTAIAVFSVVSPQEFLEHEVRRSHSKLCQSINQYLVSSINLLSIQTLLLKQVATYVNTN